MFEATAVDEATGWANALVSRVYRGPGDTVEAAMHRAEQKFGVPAAVLWALRYRRPKALLAGIYLSLKAAYEAECNRQEAKLAHELAITKTLPATPARLRLIAETEALLGSVGVAEGRPAAEPADPFTGSPERPAIVGPRHSPGRRASDR